MDTLYKHAGIGRVERIVRRRRKYPLAVRLAVYVAACAGGWVLIIAAGRGLARLL